MTMVQFLMAGVKAIGLLALMAILASCATATIDNAVPQDALGVPTQAAAEQPNYTGAYPNINVMPVGETAQLTPTDEAAALAQLADAKASQQVQGESTAAYQERLKRLRLLAKNHANDTIKQIEGK